MIDNGIDPSHFTRVIRADPDREGLLYAGTERGVYVSFDDGSNWESLQLNLPIVPVTDMAIKEQDLIVATQGRSFWVLDDLTQLHQWNDDLAREDLHLFEPRPVIRGLGGGSGEASSTRGANPKGGVPIRFMVRDVTEDTEASVEITDADGELVKRYSTKPDKNKDESELKLESGLNEFFWNTRYAAAETFDGMVLWSGGTQGPSAQPGKYTVTLNLGEDSTTSEFEIKKDPRLEIADEEYKAQFEFLLGIRDKLTETHVAIKQIRDVRKQINVLKKRLGDDEDYKELIEQGDDIVKRMTEIEETLYQTKSRSGQDPLNFPIRLNNRLSGLVSVVSSADGAPTKQAIEVHDLVVAEIDENLEALSKILEGDLKKFNKQISSAKVPFIFVEDE